LSYELKGRRVLRVKVQKGAKNGENLRDEGELEDEDLFIPQGRVKGKRKEIRALPEKLGERSSFRIRKKREKGKKILPRTGILL